MWYVILFVGGFWLGVMVMACFAYRNYNRGYRDGYWKCHLSHGWIIDGKVMTLKEMEERFGHMAGATSVTKGEKNDNV